MKNFIIICICIFLMTQVGCQNSQNLFKEEQNLSSNVYDSSLNGMATSFSWNQQEFVEAWDCQREDNNDQVIRLCDIINTGLLGKVRLAGYVIEGLKVESETQNQPFTNQDPSVLEKYTIQYVLSPSSGFDEKKEGICLLLLKYTLLGQLDSMTEYEIDRCTHPEIFVEDIRGILFRSWFGRNKVVFAGGTRSFN